MKNLSEVELSAIFIVAVRVSIEKMGIRAFKDTSFFGSNEATSSAQKITA